MIVLSVLLRGGNLFEAMDMSLLPSSYVFCRLFPFLRLQFRLTIPGLYVCFLFPAPPPPSLLDMLD